jgi:SAM-dependent methyltransferase
MGIYDYLGERYELLFPDSTEKIDFIEHGFGDAKRTLLDVGCADGGLVLGLAERTDGRGEGMLGIDPEPKMIAAATARAKERSLRCRFAVGGLSDLLTLADRPGPIPGEGGKPGIDRFGQITCLGNTLPHAGDRGEIVRFVEDCYALLKPGGVLTVQILNYDYLVRAEVREFPVIEARELRFERWNEYGEDSVLFHTRLTDGESGEVYADQTRLLPLDWKFLETTVADAGFEAVRRFSDYRGTPFDGADGEPPSFYVVRSEKPE